MKNLLILFSLFFSIISCKTFQKDTITESKKHFIQSQTLQEKNKIINKMYKEKDKIPEDLKKDYIDFFIETSQESQEAIKILIELYYDPLYKNYQNYIFNSMLDKIDNKDVFDFIEKEVYQNPELYSLKLKQKILQLNNKKMAEFLLNLIYLQKEILDPEIIYYFKTTQLEESLPILIESIEKNQFIEECFSTIAAFSTEDAQNFIINVASDYEHPYREIALSYLPKIKNKDLAFSIYLELLKNADKEKDEILIKIIHSLKQFLPFLKEEQKNELINPLKDLQRKQNLKEPISDVLKLLNIETENMIKITQKEDQISKESPNVKTNITNKNNQKLSKINLDKVNKETKNIQEQKPKIIKKNPYFSQKYAEKINKIFKKLFIDDYKEIQSNIHNSLLTYSKSNSNKAKFIKDAYKNYYQLNDDTEIDHLLKEGLFIHQSFYAILIYTKQQYQRNDLQIFALTELLNLKRVHSKKILENIDLFK